MRKHCDVMWKSQSECERVSNCSPNCLCFLSRRWVGMTGCACVYDRSRGQEPTSLMMSEVITSNEYQELKNALFYRTRHVWNVLMRYGCAYVQWWSRKSLRCQYKDCWKVIMKLAYLWQVLLQSNLRGTLVWGEMFETCRCEFTGIILSFVYADNNRSVRMLCKRSTLVNESSSRA